MTWPSELSNTFPYLIGLADQPKVVLEELVRWMTHGMEPTSSFDSKSPGYTSLEQQLQKWKEVKLSIFVSWLNRGKLYIRICEQWCLHDASGRSRLHKVHVHAWTSPYERTIWCIHWKSPWDERTAPSLTITRCTGTWARARDERYELYHLPQFRQYAI